MTTVALGGRAYTDVTDFPLANIIGPATRLVKVTLGVALANGPCRGILVGTAGTLNMTDLEGNVLTDVPIQQGYNPLFATSFQAGGTADDIWALY